MTTTVSVIITFSLMTSFIIVHLSAQQMPEKIGQETDKKKESVREREAKKNRGRSRVIEKERQRETAAVHKAIVRTLFSHAHARVESKARPISYGDSLTSRVHHRTCLYRRY